MTYSHSGLESKNYNVIILKKLNLLLEVDEPEFEKTYFLVNFQNFFNFPKLPKKFEDFFTF